LACWDWFRLLMTITASCSLLEPEIGPKPQNMQKRVYLVLNCEIFLVQASSIKISPYPNHLDHSLRQNCHKQP
jgi:hypothetical protein